VLPFEEIKRRVERAFPRNSQEIPKQNLYINMYAEFVSRDDMKTTQTIHRTTALERRRAQASASSSKHAVRVEEVCRDRARRLQNI